MVLLVIVVLGFAARSLSRERDRLLQDFAGTQLAAARDLAAGLEDRLLDLEEDARVIGTLVRAYHETPGPDAEQREQNLLASFKALATVVRHYRSLALFDQGTRLRVSAIDPAERQATGDSLLEASRSSAAHAVGKPRLTGPSEVVKGRYFYLYAFTVDNSAVVITIDAPVFLQSALRAVPDARVVVFDPGATEWNACIAGSKCVPKSSSSDAPAPPWRSDSGTAWLEEGGSRAAGLASPKAVAAWVTSSPAGFGKWKTLLVTSAAALHVREQALVRQLIATVLGLLAAIGLVGALIVREQRRAAALTERVRNAEMLRSLEGQLIRAEKLATTGVLAAGIAHEIGTPLGIMRVRADVLLERLHSPDDSRDLETIIQEIDRVVSTIRQVLDFARAQAVELQPVAPEPVLRSVLALLEHRFTQDNLTVHTNVAPRLPAIAADPNQLQQVLINILLNACDASSRGGLIAISVSPSEDRSQVIWDIRDNGAGIPEENLLAVFDPFFTTKKRGQGTGLGLSVAAGIVRNHGGQITLASKVGLGTTVSIRWPVSGEQLYVQR